MESLAEDEGVYLDGEIEASLLDTAAGLFDARPQELNRGHIDALLAEGRITQKQAAEWIADNAV